MSPYDDDSQFWIIALATMHLGQCLTCVVCCVSSQLDGTNVMENYCCSRIHDNNDLMERDSKINSLLIHTTSSSSSWEVNVNLLPPIPFICLFHQGCVLWCCFFLLWFPHCCWWLFSIYVPFNLFTHCNSLLIPTLCYHYSKRDMFQLI